jgi:hypothetical protein
VRAAGADAGTGPLAGHAPRSGRVKRWRAMSELIECDGCGRGFVTEDAAVMLAAIKGPCPSCGGTFRSAMAPLPSSTPVVPPTSS